MNKFARLVAGALVAVASSSLPVRVNAGSITWGFAETIARDSDVSTNGTTLVYAYHWRSDSCPDATVNGVTFTGSTNLSGGTDVSLSCTSVGGLTTTTPGAGLSDAYNSALSGACYSYDASGGARTQVTLNNLNVGQDYVVQVFVQVPGYGGPNWWYTVLDGTAYLRMSSSNDAGGTGQYAIGTFTADATTQVINATGWDGSARTPFGAAYINALQLRAIPPIPPVTGPLTLQRPKARQIVQRDGSNQAGIHLQGAWSGTAVRLEARALVMPGAPNKGVSTDWVVVVNAPTNGPFVGVLPGVPAGGWYRVEVRAVDAGASTVAAAGVDRIGVGDVFVTAGQSNAGCFGSPTQQPADDRVSACTLSSGAWQFAADPQPDNSGGMGTGGSAWPILGSLLVQSNDVPIGFVGVAYGGTALSQWLPGTSCFQNLTNALRTLGINGVRAVLWHQGESDSVASTTAATYAQRLSNVIASSRAAAGWPVPWGIAEVSFHPSATLAQEEPVAAGQRLCAYTTTSCFRGPRTDDFNLEGKLSDTVHFNTAGLMDHAQQWANVLCGVENLTPKNGNFEANTVLADGVTVLSSQIIGWNRLNSAGTGLAVGGNGYFNPDNTTYPNSADTINGGVLPNMNGRHAGTLAASATSNGFLETLNAHLQPSTIYTFSVALGVRSNATVFGGYRLDLLANGAPLGAGVAGDLAALNALAGGSATGAFTVVSCVYTSAIAVPANQQLAIRITKPGGAGTYLDFDNAQVTSQLTPYGQWAKLHWGSLTDPASLPEADPDADGLPNLIEFQLAGMDPLVRNATPLPVATQLGGEDCLEMRLLKNPAAGTSGAAGLLMSYNLLSWFTPTNTPNEDVIVVNNAAEFTVQLRRSASPATFFRIWAKP